MSDKELDELIAKIKNKRLSLNLSYQDLANLTGLSKSTLQRYETGYIKKVPINQIRTLAKALGTTPGYLMGWEEAPKNFQLSSQEETIIKKYRQLDADGKDRINRQLDFELYQINQSAEKEERNLG